jgi:ribosomal protein L37AE/L43A
MTMKDFAYFCPACGTASVEASGLAGGVAKCDVCKWEGKVE